MLAHVYRIRSMMLGTRFDVHVVLVKFEMSEYWRLCHALVSRTLEALECWRMCFAGLFL